MRFQHVKHISAYQVVQNNISPVPTPTVTEAAQQEADRIDDEADCTPSLSFSCEQLQSNRWNGLSVTCRHPSVQFCKKRWHSRSTEIITYSFAPQY
jgi:hypothetical protein